MDTWELTKQFGAGYDMNVSLFERLALAGFPHTTLGVQHRMHPDISALVRPTYPALEDAERTKQHPPVRGLPPGQRVVFVDHEVPEDGEAAADDEAAVFEKRGQQWRPNTDRLVKVGCTPDARERPIDCEAATSHVVHPRTTAARTAAEQPVRGGNGARDRAPLTAPGLLLRPAGGAHTLPGPTYGAAGGSGQGHTGVQASSMECVRYVCANL